MVEVRTPDDIRGVIEMLRRQRDAAEARSDRATVSKIDAAITKNEERLREWSTTAAPPQPGPVETPVPAPVDLEPGVAVLTRQKTGRVSEAAHAYLGGRAIGCRPNGVADNTALVPAPDLSVVTCQKCLAAAFREAAPEAAPEDREERRREDARRDATKGQRTPLVDYDPIGEDPPPPIPTYDPDVVVNGRSLTAGELVAMLLAGRVDASLPIRAAGKFNSSATLGAMVSLDGALVIMAVD